MYRENDCCFGISLTRHDERPVRGRFVLETGQLRTARRRSSTSPAYSRLAAARSAASRTPGRWSSARPTSPSLHQQRHDQPDRQRRRRLLRQRHQQRHLDPRRRSASTRPPTTTSSTPARSAAPAARPPRRIYGNFDNLGTVEARAGILAVQESTRSPTSAPSPAAPGSPPRGTLAFPTMFGIQTSAANLTVRRRPSMPELSRAATNTGTLTLDKGAALSRRRPDNTGTIDLGRSARLNTGTFTRPAARCRRRSTAARPAARTAR